MALRLTGSIDVSTNITSTHFSGSFSSSFQGDGSRLTGIDTGVFPHTGSVVITGSLVVTGSVSFASVSPPSAGAWSTGGALSDAKYLRGGTGT